MAESEVRYIRVVVASRDRRFLNLARFLLSRRGILVTRTCRPGVALEAVLQTGADVVVVDTNETGASARNVEELTETSPAVGVVVVAEGAAQPGNGSRLVAKWSLQNVAAAIEREHARALRSLIPSDRVGDGTAVHG